MANSSDTDLKKEASLKQNQKSPQIMSPVDRNPEEKINAYDTSNESEWESDFSTDSSDNDPLEIEFSPWNIFLVLQYLKNKLVPKYIS